MSEQTTNNPDPSREGSEPVIGFIVSTTRTSRIGREVTDQVVELARARSEATLQVIDLAEIDLPFLDEPQMPAKGNYAHETTKAWARTVAGLDAVVIVLAEYNGGYPAPLKNALDTVYSEWNGKPVLVVSYGGHGGKRSAAALETVFQTLRMEPVEPSVSITLSRDDYAEDGSLANAVVEPHQADLDAGLDALHSTLGSS